jgi:signal transduction histidine kinase
MKALTAFVRTLDSRRTSILHDAQHSLQVPVANLQDSITHISDHATREYVARGVQQCNKLLKAFDYILRLEISTIEENRQPTDLQAAVGQSLQILLPKIQAKQLSMEVEGLDTMHQVDVEPDLIELVIRALLLNSIEASPDGKVISVQSKRAHNELRLRIVDHGLGMSRIELDSLFQFYPNQHMYTTNPTDKDGPALSLIVSRMIVHAFRGELAIESVQSKGTIATLTLPLHH